MKSALVTGASSGIGRAVSLMLLRKGIAVYGIGRDFSSFWEAVSEEDISRYKENWHPIICDVMNTKELREVIKYTIIGRDNNKDISILVNNAGVGYFGPHEEINAGKLHQMVVTNLEVPMLLTGLFLRQFKQNKGTIINISSVTANKTNTHGCAYGATKAGLSSFGRSLFDEARKYGVRVCTIHPDMTKSSFYRNADFCEGGTEDTYLYPEEIAQAVEMILDSRDGLVVSEITVKPQRHQIRRKKLEG